MKRITLLTLLFILCFPVISSALMEGPDVETILDLTGNSTMSISSTTTVYTNSFKLSYGSQFSGIYTAECNSGTPNKLIELEQSDVVPASEGYSDSNYVEPDGASDIITLTDTNRHIKAFSPVATKYARYKLTGQGSNPATASISIKNSYLREQ